MAKTESRYIQFYTAGSTAQELVPVLRPQDQTEDRPRRKRQPILYIDPVAILGMVTAVVLTVCLLVAFGQYKQAKEQYEYVYSYNCTLKQEYKDLQKTYAKSYNKEEVRMEAVLMGYVPSSQLKHVTIKAEKPAPIPEEPGALEQAWIYLTELFA